MNTKLLLAATAAALVLPLQGQAQTYTDNASNYASTGYVGLGGTTPGYGAFNVTTTTNAGGNAGTFVYTAAESEGGNGTPPPSSIDSPNPTPGGVGLSFGTYANGNNTGTTDDPSVNITRPFNIPTESAGLANPGDSFSVDYVTGYNDGGMAGVALTNATGALGGFFYHTGDTYTFDNNLIAGQHYTTGALHLTYTLTSATDYSLDVTGAITYSGTGTYTSPITGFQVLQTNSAGGDGAHNSYFNNLSVTSVPLASPEPSPLVVMAVMGLGLGGLILRRRWMSAH